MWAGWNVVWFVFENGSEEQVLVVCTPNSLLCGTRSERSPPIVASLAKGDTQ